VLIPAGNVVWHRETGMKNFMACAALLVGAALGAAGFSGSARAQGSVAVAPSDLIETRQAGQDVVISVINDMKAAVAANADVKPFADDAKALARWFHNFPSLFPAGTETGHDTKAKPEVFSDPAGFAKAAQAASDAATSLAEAAKAGDAAEFAARFKTLGGACGACHRTYRVRT
jgi:cytochrome c556